MRFFLFILIAFSSFPAFAKEGSDAFRATPYPLPRFVSLRSDKVYVRSGPGHKYPVEWVFKKEGLPVEIILEYENWRKIKDFEGSVGWVHHSLLRGKRTAIIKGKKLVPIYKKQSQNSPLQAKFESGLVVDVELCKEKRCRVSAASHKGWIEKSALWGVYAAEKFD